MNTQNVSSGIISALMAYTGGLILVIDTANAAGFSRPVLISWICAVYIIGGLLNLALALMYKIPIAGCHSITAIAFFKHGCFRVLLIRTGRELHIGGSRRCAGRVVRPVRQVAPLHSETDAGRHAGGIGPELYRQNGSRPQASSAYWRVSRIRIFDHAENIQENPADHRGTGFRHHRTCGQRLLAADERSGIRMAANRNAYLYRACFHLDHDTGRRTDSKQRYCRSPCRAPKKMASSCPSTGSWSFRAWPLPSSVYSADMLPPLEG